MLSLRPLDAHDVSSSLMSGHSSASGGPWLWTRRRHRRGPNPLSLASDFLRELGWLMPKRRIWRQGQALTVYAVLESEIVPMPGQRARKAA